MHKLCLWAAYNISTEWLDVVGMYGRQRRHKEKGLLTVQTVPVYLASFVTCY